MDKKQFRQLSKLSPSELGQMYLLAVKCPGAFSIQTSEIADVLALVSGSTEVAKLEVSSAKTYHQDRDFLMFRKSK